MISFRLPAILLFTAPCLGLFIPAAGGPPPIKDFVRRLEISSVHMSEDGRYVSFHTPGKEEAYDLNLFDTETKQPKRLDLGGQEVSEHEWIDSRRMVVRYANGIMQVYDARLNKMTGNINAVGMFLTYISSLRRDQHLFVARFYDDGYYSGNRSGLAIINSQKQPFTMAGHNNVRYNVKEWLDLPKGQHYATFTDLEGEVRGLTTYHDGRLRLQYRSAPGAGWKELPLDLETTDVLGIDDPDHLYVSHYSAEAVSSRLHRYRISTNELGPALFEDPSYSMSEARLMRRRLADGSVRVLAVAYDRDVFTQRAIDPVFAEAQAAINAKLPGRLNIIEDCDRDVRRLVVASHNGREPARFVIYDRQDASLQSLPAPTPWFKPAEMSSKRPLKFPVRDGLLLEGYLSLPAKPAGGGKPPLIVHPHGGPWVRDTWGYDKRVQFLTSRGYAVFQPNYRGSAGYSKAVSKEHEFDFRRMHDDVTDGVKYIIAQGLVDETRIAIYGGSFGGYLAVAGVAFEPGLYRCAVTFAGVFDWKQMIDDRSRYRRHDRFNYDLLVKKLGDPKTERERFNSISPIDHVASIRVPVLVAHGKLDLTVEYQQSSRLLSELKKHGVPHEKLFFDTEFHGLFEPENEEKFFGELDRFLAQHL